jgi:hypothetical protein
MEFPAVPLTSALIRQRCAGSGSRIGAGIGDGAGSVGNSGPARGCVDGSLQIQDGLGSRAPDEDLICGSSESADERVGRAPDRRGVVGGRILVKVNVPVAAAPSVKLAPVRVSVAATAAAPAVWVRVPLAATAPPKVQAAGGQGAGGDADVCCCPKCCRHSRNIQSIRGEHLPAVEVGRRSDTVNFRFDRLIFGVQRGALRIGYRAVADSVASVTARSSSVVT